jgi:hypothetical protein
MQSEIEVRALITMSIAALSVAFNANAQGNCVGDINQLYAALKSDNLPQVRCQLGALGFTVNDIVYNQNRERPLHPAVDKCSEEVVIYLLRQEADPRAKNGFGDSPWIIARDRWGGGYNKIAMMIIDAEHGKLP